MNWCNWDQISIFFYVSNSTSQKKEAEEYLITHLNRNLDITEQNNAKATQK